MIIPMCTEKKCWCPEFIAWLGKDKTTDIVPLNNYMPFTFEVRLPNETIVMDPPTRDAYISYLAEMN